MQRLLKYNTANICTVPLKTVDSTTEGVRSRCRKCCQLSDQLCAGHRGGINPLLADNGSWGDMDDCYSWEDQLCVLILYTGCSF